MKVSEQPTRIHSIKIKGSEFTETEGFIASLEIDLEVELDNEMDVDDPETRSIIKPMIAAGKARVGKDGSNVFDLKAKRLYKAKEHKFLAGDKKTNVVTIGLVKWVKYMVVDGVLSMRYKMDARMPMAPMSQLATYLDAQCTLTTSDSQLDLFGKKDSDKAVPPKKRAKSEATA